MISKRRSAALAFCCLGFALPAAAQLDSLALRAKFGSPLHRETFHMPSGFDLIVDYGAANQVCKLQVPALMPTDATVSNAVEMKQRMYGFLAELAPPSMRGKELRQFASVMGTMSLLSIEYEHVTVTELQHANGPFDNNNTITVAFNQTDCASPAPAPGPR